MIDAGDIDGRGDLVAGAGRSDRESGEWNQPGGVGKRAARRRRKRPASASPQGPEASAPAAVKAAATKTKRRRRKRGQPQQAPGPEVARQGDVRGMRGGPARAPKRSDGRRDDRGHDRRSDERRAEGGRPHGRDGNGRDAHPARDAQHRDPHHRDSGHRDSGHREPHPRESHPRGDAHSRDTHPRDGQPAGRETEAAEPARRSGGRISARAASATRPLYAALDLGTNNCRLLVAEPQERGFRVVDAFSRIVRLGEGIGRSGRLSQPAMERAVEALMVCRSKMAELKVRRMRLIATEACRAAENGPIFLERVRAETGLALEIVNRETEARLAVAGCATLVDPQADGVLLFDIGGGSSELVWLDLRARGNARGFALTRFIRAWTSLPVGVVTLSERHGGVCVTRSIFEEMVAEVTGMLDTFAGIEELPRLIAEGRVHMLGTSGTVTTLAGVHLGLKRYDRRRVDGVWLKSDDVGEMIDQLLDMPFEERVANPCIGHDRADLVMAGCAILEAIRRRWPCENLRVADRGLREGILVELMARDGVWRRRAPARPADPARAGEQGGVRG